MIEIIGILAGVFVAIAYIMDGKWLRWLSLIGCLLFVIYGLAIHAWPVAGLNAFAFCINLNKIIWKKN